MNRVEIIYNPYRESSRILVNGTSISEYSQLANYLREPFEIWSTNILEYIEQEINDDFEMEITSSPMYSKILREIAFKSGVCVDLSAKNFWLDESVGERLLKLRGLEARMEDVKIGETIHVLFQVKDLLISNSLFGSMCKGGSYRVVDNSLLNEEQKVVLEVCADVGTVKENEYDFIVVIGKTELELKELFGDLSRNQIESQKYAGIIISEENRFICISNGVYIFESSIVSFVELAEELVENLAIAPYIKRNKEKIEAAVFADSGYGQEDQMNFRLIDAVEPVTMAFCQNELEEGKSADIKVTVIPETDATPDLMVRIGNPSVLKYENGKLYGLQDGETDIEIAVKGNIEPIFRQRIRVKRVVKVSKIHISESTIILKPAVKYEVDYEYEPKDADNINDMIWGSSNSNVAVVSSNGCIKSMASGECVITVTIGNVSDQCRLVVRPEMERIMVPQQQVLLTMGSSMQFIPNCEPENCYDTTILYDIEDVGIIKYDGKKIISNSLGNTRICFHDINNKIKTVVEVTVESTLYASEKSNIPKFLSFMVGIISLFLLAVSKWFCVTGAIAGVLLGVAAIVTDYKNVEGRLNVSGRPMKADCFISAFLLVVNLLIGVLVIWQV